MGVHRHHFLQNVFTEKGLFLEKKFHPIVDGTSLHLLEVAFKHFKSGIVEIAIVKFNQLC